MRTLTVDDVLMIHDKVLKATGGMPGIRDRTMLLSGIANVEQTFAGREMYPTVIDKAARFAFAISRNHPFCDGNKRTSVVAMLVMLRINGVSINCTQDELTRLGIQLASGVIGYDNVHCWLEAKMA